ncbi:MAG: ATP-binding cassette domain-containing protein [Paramuribaculum sp.]|nr:ATP-binding cassette domain-containing protein [Paramuribaculum sp.]
MENVIEYKSVDLNRGPVAVLRDVNLSAGEGELVYLIGKVGSGKTTLLKSLYGEVPVASGQATVLGYDLTRLNHKQAAMLRRQVGILFQDFRLLPDRSVADNLDIVLRATGWKDKLERETRIEEVLKRVGMFGKSYKMPHQLSGGEQQRVVMARAELNSPRLMLADEPTGNLDPDTAALIMQRLKEIAEGGATVLIATHNLALASQFDARTFHFADKSVTID